jgi:hypothetical protein
VAADVVLASTVRDRGEIDRERRRRERRREGEGEGAAQ